MKIFALILSFYILYLTALPCVDRPDDNSLAKSEISPITKDHSNPDLDHCSPFCTCNCCSSPKIQQELVLVFNSYEFLIQRFDVFLSGFYTSPPVSIWQPPQLS